MNTALLNADKSFSLETKDAKPLEAGQVRLAVAWCGVCGTDLHIFRGHMDQRLNFPEVIGHEASGTIAEVGPGVDGLSVGAPVVVRPLDACGKCAACHRGFSHICSKLNFIGIDSAGAFQRSWTVPSELVHKLPADLDLKLAAFVEPLAVACHDVRMAGLAKDEFAVVLGGGPIGLLIALVARAAGARVAISEVSAARLALAQQMGFDTIHAVEQDVEATVGEMTHGDGADVVFEVSGAAPPIKQMTKLARVRGKVVVVAIVPEPTPVDLFQVFWKELQIIGTRVYEPEDYEQAIALLADGGVDPAPLITGEFGLAAIGDAFASLASDGDHVKVLVDCQG